MKVKLHTLCGCRREFRHTFENNNPPLYIDVNLQTGEICEQTPARAFRRFVLTANSKIDDIAVYKEVGE